MTVQARTESFVLVQEMGDLHEQYDALREQWDDLSDEQAESADGQKLGAEVARRLAELEAAAVHGKFQKLGFLQWEALKDPYPPGDGEDADPGWASFASDFWKVAILACIIEPELSEDEWDTIWDRTSQGDRFRLAEQVLMLNQAALSIPKPQRPLPATTRPVSVSKRRRASA